MKALSILVTIFVLSFAQFAVAEDYASSQERANDIAALKAMSLEDLAVTAGGLHAGLKQNHCEEFVAVLYRRVVHGNGVSDDCLKIHIQLNDISNALADYADIRD